MPARPRSGPFAGVKLVAHFLAGWQNASDTKSYLWDRRLSVPFADKGCWMLLVALVVLNAVCLISGLLFNAELLNMVGADIDLAERLRCKGEGTQRQRMCDRAQAGRQWHVRGAL